uniref:RING-type domain-containing protein n=1 Tax=Xiphophorus couchianus TaxID=32473 RepID=A0A3B5KUY5_9TELE
MAERALIERYLSCHVCSESFRNPVSLSCNHSFCSTTSEKTLRASSVPLIANTQASKCW